jgi:hypothetical protein
MRAPAGSLKNFHCDLSVFVSQQTYIHDLGVLCAVQLVCWQQFSICLGTYQYVICWLFACWIALTIVDLDFFAKRCHDSCPHLSQ